MTPADDGPPFDPRREIDRELEHHIQERTDRYVELGMSPEDARRAALERFGDVSKWRQRVSRIERRGWLRKRVASGWADVRLSVRQLRRDPRYAALAILTLGLGIGAATAMFGVVKAVVLDPLPYPHPERLVDIREVTPDGSLFPVSIPNLLDYAERLSAVEDLAGVSHGDVALYTESGPRSVQAQRVTPSFFSLFGGRAIRGRPLQVADGGADPARVVVLSDRTWQTLGGPALGSLVVLDDRAHSLVGVMPEGWSPLGAPDLWLPLAVSTSFDRGDHEIQAVGRLAEVASLDRAHAEGASVAEGLGTEHPETNRGWGIRLTPLRDAIVGTDRIRAGWMLLGAVGLLMLLACGTLANLLIARASTRTTEVAVRRAIGASRPRIVQQLLTESLTLGVAAGAVGLGVAGLLIPAIRAVAPAETPRIETATLSPGVAVFCIAVALVTAAVFGLAPMIPLWGVGDRALRAGRSIVSGAGEHARRGLVALQVAAALTLLVGTGLLTASVLRLQDRDIGMRLGGTSVVSLTLPGERYSSAERHAAVLAIRARLQALPGVAAVGSSNVRPFSGMSTVIDLTVEGSPTAREDAPFVRWRLAGPGYFDAADLDLLRGRLFESADREEEAEPVVVVTRSLAVDLLGGLDDAVGRRIAMGWNGTNWRRVVGVVSDVEDLRVASAPGRTFFMADAGAWPTMSLLIRSEDPDVLVDAGTVRRAIQDVNPSLPVQSVEPLAELHRASMATPRFNLLIIGIFGALAFLLAVIGVYGVTQFAVERRTREIGVRLALGAAPQAVLHTFVRQGARLAVFGLALGTAASVLLARFIESLLFDTAPVDPWSFVGAGALVFTAVIGATFAAARRATRIDPTAALATE